MTANKWYCIAQSSTFDSSCGITIYSEGVAVSFTASVRFGSSSINIASCAIDGDILLSVRLRETDNKWCIDLLCNTEFNPTIDITDSPYWEVQNTPAGTGSILAIINDISKEFNTGVKGGESLWQLYNFGTQEKPEYAVVPKDYDGKPIGVVSKTFISFGGHNSGAEEGTGGGITTFDVYIGNDGPYSLVNGRVDLPAYPTANLTGYATENWVKEQGYLTQHQDISHLLGKEEAKDIYATIIALNEVSDRVETIESIIGIDSKGNVYIKKKADGTARDFYTYGAISFGGNGENSGSGEIIGSSVQYNASVTSGKLLGTLVIDGVDNKIYAPAIPTKLSAFTNDEGYVTEDWVNDQGFLTEEQDISHLLSKTEAANTYQPKGDYAVLDDLNSYLLISTAKNTYATIQALNGATLRIDTLETTLSTEQGYIDTLQGYFTSGKAKKAIADGNGNNIVDTYATKAALKDVADKVASLQDMWSFDEAHANTIKTIYNVVVDEAISFGGYGESSGSGGGITNITYDMVIEALGFTPYNSSNPKGYITSSALSGYATQNWVTENYQPKGDYLTSTTGVTLSTDQIITGIKTFSNGLKIGSTAIAEKTKNSTKYVEIDGNLVVTGAISFGGFGEGGSTGGGITTVTKDMVISALGYTPYNAANFTKANIKSTLGISDWALAATKPSYSKSDIGLGNVQNTAVYTRNLGVNGVNWTFASTYYTEDGTSTSVYAPTTAGTAGQYLVSNGAGAPYWITIDPYDYNNIRNANTVLAAPNGSSGNATFRKLVSADIPNLDWSKITSGKPTTLSGYGITDALSTSGGTITGNLRLKGASNYGNYLYFGDGSYTYIAELTDDQLTIKADIIKLDGEVNISGTKLDLSNLVKLTGNQTITGVKTFSNGIYIGSTKIVYGSDEYINVTNGIVADSEGAFPLVARTSSTSGVGMSLFMGSAQKASIIWTSTYGASIVNNVVKARLGILDDGTPHFNVSNTLVHTGNLVSKIKDAGNITINGNLVATGSITFGSASDRRLKDNIKSMTDKQAVAVLSALNPVTFKWNSTAYELGKLSGVSDGFIADEYEKIIPNSGRDIWTNYRAINYERATGHLVKGWQNHETRLEKAERRIKELENELKQYRRA